MSKELKDKILAEYEKGNVVVKGVEGLQVMPIKDFVSKQPADGILYDLNRDEATVLTFIDDPKWINDFAVAKTIRELMNQLADLRAENERLKEGFELQHFLFPPGIHPSRMDKLRTLCLRLPGPDNTEVKNLLNELADEERDIETITKDLTFEKFQKYQSKYEALAASHRELVEILSDNIDRIDPLHSDYPVQEEIFQALSRAEQILKSDKEGQDNK